jgi:hypothetical protein
VSLLDWTSMFPIDLSHIRVACISVCSMNEKWPMSILCLDEKWYPIHLLSGLWMQRSLVRCGILLPVTDLSNAYACISALRSLKSDLACEGEEKKKEKKKEFFFWIPGPLVLRGGLYDRQKKTHLGSHEKPLNPITDVLVGPQHTIVGPHTLVRMHLNLVHLSFTLFWEG